MPGHYPKSNSRAGNPDIGCRGRSPRMARRSGLLLPLFIKLAGAWWKEELAAKSVEREAPEVNFSGLLEGSCVSGALVGCCQKNPQLKRH